MTQNLMIGSIAGIMTIVGTVFAMSLQFVSKSTFIEFKEGTVGHIEKRMDSMDNKLDKIIEEQRRLSPTRTERGH